MWINNVNNMQTLTKRQKQILDFIAKYIKKSGISPTYEEIGKRFKLSALSTVHQHVEALINKNYLLKNDNSSRGIEIKKTVDDFIQIPLKGTIAAGQPIEAIEEKETIAIPKSSLPRSGNIYALKVAGDSMIEENINDGDIILVKKQNTAVNGQKVVALIDNQEATLKQFYKEKKYIRLQPANKNFEPIIIKRDKEFSIQGVVLDVIKNEKNELLHITDLEKKQKKLPLNRIICGDAVDIMQSMPVDSIDLVVTSPPYDNLRSYNGYSFDFEGMAKGLFRVMKKGGVIVWVVGDQTIKGDETGTSFRQALYFKRVGFNLFDTMIYLKTPRGAVGNNNTYWQAFEYMFILSKGTPKTINLIKDRENKDERDGDNGTKRLHDGTLLKQKRAGYSKYGRRTNVWEYLIGRGHSSSDSIAYKHPAIFPEKLVQDHIISWTTPGDVVLDPMCGSGTTCKIAKLNKRDFIGIDISSEYCKIAEERLKQKSLF